MNTSAYLLPRLCVFLLWPCIALGQSVLANNTHALRVHAQMDALDLSCPLPQKAIASRKPTSSNIYEIPDMETVEQEKFQLAGLSTSQGGDKADPAVRPQIFQPQPPQSVYRIALWGDSHMAAGFFSNELIRLLGISRDQVSSTFIPANMNRGGVRLPVKKTCISSGWRHESAHASADAAQFPGPALVNLYSETPNSFLAWDLRNSTGARTQARPKLLFQQTSQPIVISVSVDGAAEQEVTLSGSLGPATLEFQSDTPISTLKLRLLSGSLRVHGLRLSPAEGSLLGFDLFGFPGATVAGWKQNNLRYFKSWFSDVNYQTVILAYGTNEGNNKPFDSLAYRQLLDHAVVQMRSAFPSASCLLIAPGDRGILVSRKPASHVKKKSKTQHNAGSHIQRASLPPGHPDLFNYSRIHQQIRDIQKEVAFQHGCASWSMYDAMGGAGSAYSWARATPALMASDLIHFTPLGYERLSQSLAQDMDWRKDQLWLSR